MVDEYGLVKIDATKTIHEQQLEFRKIVNKILQNKGIKIAETK